MNTDLFKLLRLGLGLEQEGDDAPKLDEEGWRAVFQRLQEQALIGIGFAGIGRLPKESAPPRKLLLQWFALTEQITRRNAVLDGAVVKLCKELDFAGWRFCILKGQTVARYYSAPALRQSGDIDVWIYGRKDGCKVSRRDIISYLEQGGRKVKLCYLHADGITMDGDVAVEVHFHPSHSVCPWRNYRLQAALKTLYTPNYSNINGADIPSASYEFNRLFMLHHIYRHIFSEGIGLRQVVDYAMLLKQKSTGLDQYFEQTLRHLGMLQFAKGVMWILQECLHVQSGFLYTSPDKQEGEFILKEIMQSGNFGLANSTETKRSNKWQRFTAKAKRNLSFIRKYPSEVFCYIPFEVYETLTYKLPHR